MESKTHCPSPREGRKWPWHLAHPSPKGGMKWPAMAHDTWECVLCVAREEWNGHDSVKASKWSLSLFSVSLSLLCLCLCVCACAGGWGSRASSDFSASTQKKEKERKKLSGDKSALVLCRRYSLFPFYPKLLHSCIILCLLLGFCLGFSGYFRVRIGIILFSSKHVGVRHFWIFYFLFMSIQSSETIRDM